MKNLFLIIFWILVKVDPCSAQAGEWTWMKGDSIGNTFGSWGTLGVADASNIPPAQYEACQWTDMSGNFWLYGGVMSNNGPVQYCALWKYNEGTNNWTWITGPSAPNQPQIYGTQGIPGSGNNPGIRSYGSATWTDTSGNLWLFGGFSGANSSESDLWKYDISTNEWTWMNGPNYFVFTGEYGTLGTPDAANYPPPRNESVCAWTDSKNHLWLYGGKSIATSSSYSDLWQYDISSNEWTWINGSNLENALPVYGIKGISNASNQPGARCAYARWIDDDDNLWLFGGEKEIYDSILNYHVFFKFNDLWKYSMNLNEWTWVSGTANGDDPGAYGKKCSSSPDYIPDGRFESKSCWQIDNMFYLYGGKSNSAESDLWAYNFYSNEWGWINGDSVSINSSLFGSQGISSPDNKPGPRMGAVSWTDVHDNLWMFGGAHYDNGFVSGNDLWRFVPDSNCNLFQSVLEHPDNNIILSVFPNPSSGTFTIELLNETGGEQVSIDIVNTLGQKVFTTRQSVSSANWKREFDLQEVARGIYFIEIRTKDASLRKKIVIEE